MDIEKSAQAASEAVDTRELVSLLQQMVRIRSYSAGGEEGTIARFMRDYLAALGLEVELQEVERSSSFICGFWTRSRRTCASSASTSGREI